MTCIDCHAAPVHADFYQCLDCFDASYVPALGGRKVTADGVPITVGLRVFTNNLDLGTVVALNDDGWHDVKVGHTGGLPDRFNGERLTTRNPFTQEVAR